MPNKLTDTEIKKALECLAYHKECPESEMCPYYMDNGDMCDNISLAKDALDLINRLEGENEKNENIIRIADKTIATLNAENQSLKAEVERLREECGIQSELWSNHYESLYQTALGTIKPNAYKELVKKLKEKLEHFPLEKENFVSEENIDNLLNELVGDGDAK